MMEKQVEQKKNQFKITKKDEENHTKIDKDTESATNVSKNSNSNSNSNSNPPVWDCGSSLYDSFELKSFERQLDSAINSRTLSMPHLANRQVISHHLPQPSSQSKKPSSKISRSFHRLLRSLFKPKSQNGRNNTSFFPAKDQQPPAAQDGFFVVYDRSRTLSTIPEIPELDGFSPEINKSLVRRTASDRFTVTSIGISCA
ncbi:hypothetical protein ACH5RR_038339 [Cinchona calisaya]|uniref:Ovate family protein n=1 Tax=Cinchona calisaya TaxID=153742 RepID=A0ABD2XWV8_9GENT